MNIDMEGTYEVFCPQQNVQGNQATQKHKKKEELRKKKEREMKMRQERK